MSVRFHIMKLGVFKIKLREWKRSYVSLNYLDAEIDLSCWFKISFSISSSSIIKLQLNIYNVYVCKLRHVGMVEVI